MLWVILEVKMTFKAIFRRFGEFLEKVGWEEGFSENCLKGHFWPFNAKNWFYQSLTGDAADGPSAIFMERIKSYAATTIEFKQGGIIAVI